MADIPYHLAAASGVNSPVTISGIRTFMSNYTASSTYRTALQAAAENGVQISVKGFRKAVVTMVQNRISSVVDLDSVYLDGVQQADSTAGGTFDLTGVDTLTIKGITIYGSSNYWSTNEYTVTLS